MRKLWLLLVLTAPAWLVLSGALAQETAGGVIFARYRQFKIPFNTGPASARLRQLQLYLSTDQGRTWQPSTTAPPDQGHFRFSSERDGFFWFTVQTQDTDGKLYPATLDGAAPSLKVVIDTQPPTVTLQSLTPRNGEVGVSWNIGDDNFDPAATDALRLEYRVQGNPTWINVTTLPNANQVTWSVPSSGPIEVRLRARDRAGNVGESNLTLGGGFSTNNQAPAPQQPNNQAAAPFQDNDNHATAPAVPPESERRLVGSTRIVMNYEIKEKGPSGVSRIELWQTQDGRNWNQFGEVSPEKDKGIAFDVPGDGVYGITLLAKSGVGLGDRPPRTGDRPQIWIEVDTVKPVVTLDSVMVGTGVDKGKLNIIWTARDKNLHTHPIKLSYAEQRDGQWTLIADRLSNTGRYIWNMPPAVPYQFHLKVEAADRAGNIGEAVTESLVKVDLAQPKIKILQVGPGER